MSTQEREVVIGVAGRFWRAFCEGLSGFSCVFKGFWKFFGDFLAPLKRAD